jgi:hypothetical protein
MYSGKVDFITVQVNNRHHSETYENTNCNVSCTKIKSKSLNLYCVCNAEYIMGKMQRSGHKQRTAGRINVMV